MTMDIYGRALSERRAAVVSRRTPLSIILNRDAITVKKQATISLMPTGQSK